MSELSRLRWRCRRGIKEMDIVFEHFIDQYFTSLSTRQKELFERILDEKDLDILDWILGRSRPADADYEELIVLFQQLDAGPEKSA